MAVIIDGLDKLDRNLDNLPQIYLRAAKGRMDYELRGAVNHIKEEYDRPKTGKGFTDQTGNLRNSIDKQVEQKRDEVNGYVYAGMEYAPEVELRFSGKFAYLWPGVKDKKDDIVNGLAESMGDAAKKVK